MKIRDDQQPVPWEQISCSVLKNIDHNKVKGHKRGVDENALVGYIKNNHANYKSYFPLEVKGLTGKNIFIHAQRLPLELVFLMKFVLSQNPITQRKIIIE